MKYRYIKIIGVVLKFLIIMIIGLLKFWLVFCFRGEESWGREFVLIFFVNLELKLLGENRLFGNWLIILVFFFELGILDENLFFVDWVWIILLLLFNL